MFGLTRPVTSSLSLSDIRIIHWRPVKILLDGISVKLPIALSAFTLKVYYMLLQAVRRILMNGVLHGVTIQH